MALESLQNRTKLGRAKDLGGKIGVLVGRDLPLASGELKQGSDPILGTNTLILM